MLQASHSDIWNLQQKTTPSAGETDVVSNLEAILRSDKKANLNDQRSEQLGGGPARSPDTGLPNTELQHLAATYAPGDKVIPSPGISSVQADFSRLLGQMSPYQTESAGIARSNLMGMAFSTIQNGRPEGSHGLREDAQRIIQAQLNYELASDDQKMEMASQAMHLTTSKFGLHSREKRAVAHARNHPLMANSRVGVDA